jgi:hypothetical protein
VGDLDGVHAGRVEGGGDPRDVGRGDAVPDGVHAVAQGHVLDEDPHAGILSASRDATRTAADVMMSRFPAYAGR